MVAVVNGIEQSGGYEVRHFADVEALRNAVRRFEIAAGAVVPAEASASLTAGVPVSVTVIGDPTSSQAAGARSVIERSVTRSGDRAAVVAFVAAESGVKGTAASAVVDAVAVPRYSVEVHDVGAAVLSGRSSFSLTAPQNLVLFTFINTLGAGALLIRLRRQSVLRRISATPTSTSAILVGLGAGWMSVALLQSVLILIVGRVGFGVQWGNPIGAGLVVFLFAAVGAATGLLLGAFGRNEDRAGSMTPVIGLVAGALGGCMIPLEVFPSPMATLARLTPHYWAMDAWQSLIFDDAGLRTIAPNLAVLVGFAFVIGGVAVVLLRRDLRQ